MERKTVKNPIFSYNTNSKVPKRHACSHSTALLQPSPENCFNVKSTKTIMVDRSVLISKFQNTSECAARLALKVVSLATQPALLRSQVDETNEIKFHTNIYKK